MTRLNISRRRLLAVGSGTVLAGGIATFGVSRYVCGSMRQLASVNQTTLAYLIASPALAKAIGQTYMRQVAAEALDINGEIKAKEIDLALHYACPNTGAETILQKVSTDFKENDIVIVDRWVIARTEAIVCSYYATLSDTGVI